MYMADCIVFFLLFVLPFVIAPFGVTQFENPKVIIGEVGIIFLLLISIFTNTLIYPRKSPQIILFVVIICLTFIDILFFRTQTILFGNAFRMQGIFLLWFL